MKIYINLLATFYFLLTSNVFAQSAPEFLVSWRAKSYVPADYQGKVFPGKNSLVEAGFDLVDGNKIADLSKNEIRWFLDNELMASGLGLKTFKFNAKKGGGNDHALRIAVSNYKGKELETLVTVPVASPEIVISTKNPLNQFSLGNYTLQAMPYFFNTNSLNNLLFNWTAGANPVAGQPENPNLLNLDLTSEGPVTETQLAVSVNVKNVFDQIEMAFKNLNLIVK